MKHAGKLGWLVSVLALPVAAQAALSEVERAAQAGDINQQLDERIRAVQDDYLTERQAIVEGINRRFGIDYEALRRQTQSLDDMIDQRRAIIEKLQDERAKQRQLDELIARLTTPAYRQFEEAQLALDYELERRHLLRARCLDAYEQIIDALVDADPLLHHFFHSADYTSQYGLLLKQVVWTLGGGEAASTKPLDTYTMFADRRRMPFLIKVSRSAFSSLAYLRSMLIHELTHVLLSKNPQFASLTTASSAQENAPTKPPPDAYGLFFNLRRGWKPGYQFYLLHEHYAFKGQLLYDDFMGTDIYHRLPSESRSRIEALYAWTLGELSERHRAFLQRYPDPPIAAYIKRLVHPAPTLPVTPSADPATGGEAE